MSEWIKWEQIPEDNLCGFEPGTIRGYLEGDERVTVYTIEDYYVEDAEDEDNTEVVYDLYGAFIPDDFEEVKLNRQHKTIEAAKQTAEQYFVRWCQWNLKALMMAGTREAKSSHEGARKELLGTEWTPKNRKYTEPWKIAKIFQHEDGERIFRLEKIHGGRNSPALVTLKKLKQNFKQIE